MMKVAGVLAFVALLLIAGVTEAPAVAFNSAAGIGSCAGTATFPLPTTCAGGFVAITPDAAWQPNNPGVLNASPAIWVSYANTGAGGVVVTPNVAPPLTPVNATETFTVTIPAGFASLSLLVWADDTAGVRVGANPAYLASTTVGASAPNPVQGANCAAGGLTCVPGGGAAFLIPLGGLGNTLSFDVFQRGAGTFGLLYQGELTPVPEPASLLLLGTALAAVGFISRKRFQRKQQQS